MTNLTTTPRPRGLTHAERLEDHEDRLKQVEELVANQLRRFETATTIIHRNPLAGLSDAQKAALYDQIYAELEQA